MSQLIFCLSILPAIVSAFSSVLRVETGHQNIEIQGRDPYFGYFTRIRLHDVTCIQSIIVHCLKPLTGAEEIDLLFLECASRAVWKVGHYTNTKEEFRLKEHMIAREMLISSRKPLTIIDVQVKSCSNSTTKRSLHCHSSPLHPSFGHSRRHGKTGPIRAVDDYRTRRKRETSSPKADKYPENAEFVITRNKLVKSGESLTVEKGVRLRFAEGVGLVVYGTLIVNGTQSSPVIFEPQNEKNWRGVEIVDGSPSSSISYLNVIGSELGLTIKGATPTINDVIVNGSDVGFRIESNSSAARLVNSYAINNKGAGFHFVGKSAVQLIRCISASNREHGFYARDSTSVHISNSNTFSNSQFGLFAENVDTVEITDTVVDGNSAGIRISADAGKATTIGLEKVNISNHHYGPAIQMKVRDTVFSANKCHLYDNYNGGVIVEGESTNSQFSIFESNFTRIRGRTLSIPLMKSGRGLIRGNTFHANQFNEYNEKEAVIEIGTAAERRADVSIRIDDNQFTKNIMNNIVDIRRISGTSPDTVVSHCDFHSNLAQSIIRITSTEVEIRENFFHNVQSDCEISSSSPSEYDVARNYFGYDTQKELLSHICPINDTIPFPAYNTDSVTSTPATVIENKLPSLDNTYNLIKATPTPYTINSDVTIPSGFTVIVEPGAKFLFAAGVGLTVQEKGKLILNGTSSEPIEMSSAEKENWRGIVVKPGGLLSISNTVVRDASVGLWIDSDRFSADRAIIENSAVHGVEITSNAGVSIDLGGTSIRNSQGTALAVDERKGDVTISNVEILNSSTGGIDFVSPSGNIKLENIEISGSGSHSVHLSEFPAAPLLSVSITNMTISDQVKGHAGLLISSGWATHVDINRFTARENTVPSIVLALQCDWNTSRTRITNSKFISNRGSSVVSLQLGECGGLDMERNLFEGNNADGKGGVVRVEAEPRPGSSSLPISVSTNRFLANGGDFVVFLQSEGNPVNGTFYSNQMEGNVNSVASVIVASPSFQLRANRFADSLTVFELEPRGDGSWILDASNNYWGTQNINKVMNKVNAAEGTVRLLPLLSDSAEPNFAQAVTVRTTEAAPILSTAKVEAELNLITSTAVAELSSTVNSSAYQQCSHINYCSYRGTCLGGICLCPIGFIGNDCSISVGCQSNCSTNGLCNVFNVCYCYPGWTSEDCSVAICAFDCGGHGECVSKDECNCDDDWTGPFCLEEACSEENCQHGECQDKKCVCDQSWNGHNCDLPICSNCSLNGQCVNPEQCECFEDYGGENCTECVGPACSACEFDCDHGDCVQNTGTCSCEPGWSGAACDVCEKTICATPKSRVVYILPSTVEKDDSNTVVTVFGEKFAKPKSGQLKCIFGTSSTEGMRVSSSVIRCPIPPRLSLGRHLFNVASGGEVAATIDNRPLHFIIYDACSPSKCKGRCMGPLCICPKGKTGLDCDVIELVPEIDRHFLSNQVANIAEEGTPYVVYLPSMPGTVLRINSTVPSLHFDSARGLLEWAEPIGNEKPYEITAIADSLAGESSITWNLTVHPSYTAQIDDVISEGNRLSIEGKIVGEKIPPHVPVVISISNDRTEERVEVFTNEDGSFNHTFLPATAGTYNLMASHPGVKSNDKGKSVVIKLGPAPISISESDNQYSLRVKEMGNCTAELLNDVQGTVKVRMEGSDTYISVTLGESSTTDVFISLTCNGEKQIVRLPVSSVPERQIWAEPNSLVFSRNTSSPTARLTKLTVHLGISLSSPLSITSDGTQPIEVVGSEPPLESYRDYDMGKRDLKIALKVDISRIGNSSLFLVENGETLLRLPVSIVENNKFFVKQKFRMQICVEDEWRGRDSNQRPVVAAVSLTNLQYKVDLTQSNVDVNGRYSDFWIPEGVYQIRVTSPVHDTLSQLAKLTPHNSTLCLRLQTSSPMVFALDGKHLESALIGKSKSSLPYLVFSPSVLNGTVSRVLVDVRGDVPGLISVTEIDNQMVKMTPQVTSIASNSSFWMTVEPKSTSHTDCAARAIQVPFVFVPESSSETVELLSPVLVQQESASGDVCRDDGSSMPIASISHVLCDCAQGARAACRKTSAAACSSSWARIADDTVSLETLSAFFLMIVECSDVGVDFGELDKTLQCVSSLESECPLSRRMKRQQEDFGTNSTWDLFEDIQNDGPASIINHLASVQDSLPVSFLQPQIINILNALDMQSIRVAALYQEFFHRIQVIFPPSLMIISREVADDVIMAMGDGSERGNILSQDEVRKIGDQPIVRVWNDTVTSWRAGKWSRPDGPGIQYADVKQLVTAADRLKSFTRQNGGTDPFSVLHEYIGRLLATGTAPTQECASATVLIEPNVLYEGDSAHFKVHVTNTQTHPLTSASLTLEILRDDPFSPTAELLSNGIGVQTGTPEGKIEQGESFEMIWSKRIVLSRKLTATAKYQAIIVLSFTVNGKTTKQRLKSSSIEIRPTRSLKVVHFLSPSLTSPKIPFSLMTSIMNIGYSSLTSVDIHSTDISVVGGNGAGVDFSIDSKEVDGEEKGTSLSYSIGSLESGSSKTVTMNITSPNEKARVSSVGCWVTAEDSTVSVDESDTYIIHAMAGENGMLVSLPQSELPLFFFRPETGTIVNIVKLRYIASQSQNAEDPNRKIVRATFHNEEPRSFTGFLWASIPLPEMTSEYRLIRISARDRDRMRIIPKTTWIEGEGASQELNFIDNGFTTTPYQIDYELVFVDPAHFSVPTFAQNSYRIQLMSENWPNLGDPVGQIGTNSNESEKVEYELYSPDNSGAFSVQPETGHVFLNSPVLPGQELCLVLVARDERGQESRVPLAVNTGGIRKECVLFDTDGLTPLLHQGSPPISTLAPPTTFTGVYTTLDFSSSSPSDVEIPTPPIFPTQQATPTTTGTTTGETIYTISADLTPEPILTTPSDVITSSNTVTEMPPTPSIFTWFTQESSATTVTETPPTLVTVPETPPTPPDFTASATSDFTTQTEETSTQDLPTPPILTVGTTLNTETPPIPPDFTISPTGDTTASSEQTTTEDIPTPPILTAGTTLDTETTPTPPEFTIGTVTADPQVTDYTTEEMTTEIFASQSTNEATPTEMTSSSEATPTGTTSSSEATPTGMTSASEATPTVTTSARETTPTGMTSSSSKVTSQVTPTESSTNTEDWVTYSTSPDVSPSETTFIYTVTPTVELSTFTPRDRTTPQSDQTTTEFIYTLSSEKEPVTIPPTTPSTDHTEEVTNTVTQSTTEEGHTIIVIPTDGSHGGTTTSSNSEATPTMTSSNSEATPTMTSPDGGTPQPTEDMFTEACKKASLPVWNLICELSKTIVVKGR